VVTISLKTARMRKGKPVILARSLTESTRGAPDA
jgi:hypothetical protein